MDSTLAHDAARARRDVTLLCPHCHAPAGPRDPAIAARCMTCRLIVGAGRLVTAEGATTAGTRASSAANVLSARARREPLLDATDLATATADVSRVARELGVSPDRLRMLDYQTAHELDDSLASLGQVVGIHGSWKAARSAALAAGRTRS